MDKILLLDKKVGETPLECLEGFRASKIAEGHAEFAGLPMTYAGRLDPMASGALLILLGEECKKKEKYLGLDKEYEVEILFGVETDTQDVLGLITKVADDSAKMISRAISNIDLQKYVGKFAQKYPAYSSKTVGGKQLHTHAREGTLPDADEMPSLEVEIYSIKKNGEKNGCRTMTGAEIARKAIEAILKVRGDFRQNEILDGWNNFSKKYGTRKFTMTKIRVLCSSGTYMRSLAEKIGKHIKIGADAGVGALAFSIHRTKIAGF